MNQEPSQDESVTGGSAYPHPTMSAVLLKRDGCDQESPLKAGSEPRRRPEIRSNILLHWLELVDYFEYCMLSLSLNIVFGTWALTSSPFSSCFCGHGGGGVFPQFLIKTVSPDTADAVVLW